MNNAKCHPDRPARTKKSGLCASCYQKQWSESNPENASQIRHRVALHRKRNKKYRETHKAAALDYYRKNRDKIIARRRERLLNDPTLYYQEHLRHKYNITYEDYKSLFRSQDGRCAICRTDKIGSRRHFSVDHCHSTGKVRGLLCGECNRGIGNFKDNPSLLLEAIQYLEKTK